MDRHASRPLRHRLWAASGLFAVLVMTPAASSVLAAEPIEVLFSYTGAEQTFDVPAGVTSIHVVLVGAPGGTAHTGNGPRPLGGIGARVEGDLAVTPGSRLYVEVGGAGGTAVLSGATRGGVGGFNGGATGGPEGTSIGGGGGGGASDIRLQPRGDADSLSSRLIVAGGGGGGGAGTDGGTGGHAGTPGTDATTGESGGAPGTATAGGTGGAGSTNAGSDGVLGSGGMGGGTNAGGGGGGGGYFGGGGGASGTNGGGGGGGSSFLGTAAAASSGTSTTGTPSITITYTVQVGPTPPPDSGVVDANVTVPTSAVCIELSTTSVTFGTQRFGGENLVAAPGITVTNCSGSDESLLARGTDATGGSATWHLVDNGGTCGAGTLAIDDYHLKLRRADTDEVTQLASNNKAIRTLTAGAEGTLDALLDMPCPGSSGAGETMGMQIVFVVTE